MSVNAKHIATFLLGAAAGFALGKYSSMSDEEKEKFAEDLKNKANSFKQSAEETAKQAKDYFEELKNKGAQALKENMAEAENIINNLFNPKKQEQ